MAFKMAIIGYGGMGSWHHKNITMCNPEFIVKGAYDIRKEAQQKVVETGLYCYKTAEELYADKELDLVLVATPNDFHKGYAIACLEAGKNVISEKPAAISRGELEDILAVSRETGKFFTVHQNRRWDSDYLTAKKIIQDGILKNPYSIESHVQGSRRVLHGWRGHKLNGGGMVFDWGVHLIDQMLDFFPGKIVSVDAHLHNIFTPEVDDNFISMFRFDNGLTYIVAVSMNCFILHPRWHISCEDGTAVIQNWECEGKIAKLKEDCDLDWAEEIVYTAAGPTRSMSPRPKETTEEIALPVVKGEWSEFYKNIAGVLAGKAELIVKPEQALRVMNVIDAIFESQKLGRGIVCEI